MLYLIITENYRDFQIEKVYIVDNYTCSVYKYNHIQTFETTIHLIVPFINGINEDFNQILIYTTNNTIFNIINNQLILKTKLNYNKQQFINLFIRAIDNGQPTLFVYLFYSIKF